MEAFTTQASQNNNENNYHLAIKRLTVTKVCSKEELAAT